MCGKHFPNVDKSEWLTSRELQDKSQLRLCLHTTKYYIANITLRRWTKYYKDIQGRIYCTRSL